MSKLMKRLPFDFPVGRFLVVERVAVDDLRVLGLGQLPAKTYFPPGAGVLFIRRHDGQFESQLGEVDEAGRFGPVRPQPSEPQEAATGGGDGQHGEPVASRQFQGMTILEPRLGFLQKCLQALRRALGLERGDGGDGWRLDVHTGELTRVNLAGNAKGGGK